MTRSFRSLAAVACVAIGLLLLATPADAQLRALNLNARANLVNARANLVTGSTLGLNQNLVLQAQVNQLNAVSTLNTVAAIRQAQQLQQLQALSLRSSLVAPLGFRSSVGFHSSFAVPRSSLFLSSGGFGFGRPAVLTQRVFTPSLGLSPFGFRPVNSFGLSVPVGRSNLLFFNSRF